jgi:glycosyltransferase involved in cell wall biosynthesis
LIRFLSVFSPYRGGIATFSDHLLIHLQKLGDVRPVNFKAQYPSMLFPGKNQFYDSPERVIEPRSYHSYNPINWLSTAKEISSDQPDWLIFSQWHPFFIPGYRVLMNRVSRSSPKTKFAAVVHNVLPHESFPMQESLLKSFFNRLELAVVLSDQTREEILSLNTSVDILRSFHPVYPRQLSEKSAGELRLKWGLEEDSIILLFFGLIRDYKGIDVLFHAMNQLSEEERERVQIVIAGEFYMDESELTSVLNTNVSSRVSIYNHFMNDEELGELFVLSDAMVLPYKTASQSGVIAEAIFANLPVITTNHPGLTNYIHHGKNGYIAEPDDVESLAEILKNLKKEALKKMGNQQSIEAKKYSWEELSNQILGKLK